MVAFFLSIKGFKLALGCLYGSVTFFMLFIGNFICDFYKFEMFLVMLGARLSVSPPLWSQQLLDGL